MLTRWFVAPPRLGALVSRPAPPGPWPEALSSILSPETFAAAEAEIVAWDGYRPTPLRSLDRLAGELDLGAILYKDESGRFGLGSFKALGGAYAVLRYLGDVLGERLGRPVALSDIRAGRFTQEAATITVAAATDGNHGRAVAWGAQAAGCKCRIFVHAGVSEGRKAAMAAFGAEVVQIAGDYDASIRICAEQAAANGWQVISDTAYEGYDDIPRQVMAGYGLLAAEILDETMDNPPTHVFVQAGVGGLAAALCARMWQALGPRRPVFVLVEPERAACLTESARRGQRTAVEIVEETVMAGLSCGEVSSLAWEILAPGAAHFVTISDDDVAPAMRMMAKGDAGGGAIEAGECAVSGLIAMIAAARDPEARQALGLGADSRVVLIGSEGATDPEIYRALLNQA